MLSYGQAEVQAAPELVFQISNCSQALLSWMLFLATAIMQTNQWQWPHCKLTQINTCLCTFSRKSTRHRQTHTQRLVSHIDLVIICATVCRMQC